MNRQSKTPLFLNHVISFTNASNINKYLQKYKKAGFVVGEETVRHAPGKRNGFVYFGPEYIEFSWVEDKKDFSNRATNYEKYYQKNPSPFGLAFESKDVNQFHKIWRRRGFKVPSIWSKGPRNADKSVIWWSFQNIPLKYLAGCWTFVLTYITRKWEKTRKIKVGKNTTYAISGITFVTRNPKQRAMQWKKLLAPMKKSKNAKPIRSRFSLGPHDLSWVTPGVFKKKYGYSHKIPKGKNGKYGEIALIHLLAEDIKKAYKKLRTGGFKVKWIRERLFVFPMKTDGFTFLIEEKKISKWKKEQEQRGYKLLVKR